MYTSFVLWNQEYDRELLDGSLDFLYKAGHWQVYVKAELIVIYHEKMSIS